MLGLKVSRHFIAFVIGGMISAGIELGSFIVLKQLDVSTFWAAFISFCLGMVISYIVNSSIIFSTDNKRTLRHQSKQFSLYVTLAVVNSIISSAGVTMLASFLGVAIIAKLIMMALIAAWNYFILKKFIFGDHTPR